MESLRKISLIVLAVLALAAGAWAAAQVAPPYPTDFRIYGTIQKYNGMPADISNFKVVFYRTQDNSYAAGHAFALTDASGFFNINAHDDWTLLPLAVSSASAPIFHLGIVSNGSFGLNEALVPITASDLRKGFINLDGLVELGLKPGEGIPDPTGPLPTVPIVDTGRIRSTNIMRNGNDLVLTWDYDAQGPTAVNILVAGAAGAAYEADAAKFTLLTVVPSGTRNFTDSGKGTDINNYYYRVVPATLVTGTNLLDPQNNSITVGKTYLTLPANKYVFASLPFLEDNILLSDVIKEQAGDSGELLWWDGAAYHGMTYASGSWIGEDHNLRVGEGFIIRAKADRRLALAGRFGTLERPFVVNLKGDQYNLLGYPYPQTGVMENMGITADDGADLLAWTIDTQGYVGATSSVASGVVTWKGPAGINSLSLADPRYYRPKADHSWTIRTP